MHVSVIHHHDTNRSLYVAMYPADTHHAGLTPNQEGDSGEYLASEGQGVHQ